MLWNVHRVSKKLCQLIFCSLSVKYEPISIQIGRIIPEETFNKTVGKVPTSPKVCACTTLGNLKCQIEPLTQCFFRDTVYFPLCSAAGDITFLVCSCVCACVRTLLVRYRQNFAATIQGRPKACSRFSAEQCRKLYMGGATGASGRLELYASSIVFNSRRLKAAQMGMSSIGNGTYFVCAISWSSSWFCSHFGCDQWWR